MAPPARGQDNEARLAPRRPVDCQWAPCSLLPSPCWKGIHSLLNRQIHDNYTMVIAGAGAHRLHKDAQADTNRRSPMGKQRGVPGAVISRRVSQAKHTHTQRCCTSSQGLARTKNGYSNSYNNPPAGCSLYTAVPVQRRHKKVHTAAGRAGTDPKQRTPIPVPTSTQQPQLS